MITRYKAWIAMIAIFFIAVTIVGNMKILAKGRLQCIDWAEFIFQGVMLQDVEAENVKANEKWHCYYNMQAWKDIFTRILWCDGIFSGSPSSWGDPCQTYAISLDVSDRKVTCKYSFVTKCNYNFYSCMYLYFDYWYGDVY